MHMQQNFYGDTGMKIGKHHILIIAFIGLPMLILITITTIIRIKIIVIIYHAWLPIILSMQISMNLELPVSYELKRNSNFNNCHTKTHYRMLYTLAMQPVSCTKLRIIISDMLCPRSWQSLPLLVSSSARITSSTHEMKEVHAQSAVSLCMPGAGAPGCFVFTTSETLVVSTISI